MDKYIPSFEQRRNVDPRVRPLTLYEHLRDFGVAGAESTVEFKAIGIVKERASQREEDFLWEKGWEVTQPAVSKIHALVHVSQTQMAYLKLIHSFQLLQIRDQSGSIFQSLEKFNLELHHFWQVPKQYIQLEEMKKINMSLNSSNWILWYVCFYLLKKDIPLLQVHAKHCCSLPTSPSLATSTPACPNTQLLSTWLCNALCLTFQQ